MVAKGNKLVEVNMKHPELSEVIMDFPPWALPVHGLTTVQVNCDSTITFATGRGAGFYSEIYVLDIDNLALSNYCSVPLSITGAANNMECVLPPCDLFVDLDKDNSSLAFRGNYCADPFCHPPLSVADTDVVILSMTNTLDSLVLELTGILNGTSEYLEVATLPSSLTVLGDGSTNLLFINNGSATLAEFEAALKSVLYQNDASTLSYGMRRVLVTGWSGGVASILSTADIPLSDKVLQATVAADLPSCYSLQDGSLAIEVGGGVMPYTYQWLAGSMDSLLTGIGAGNYPVTITDSNGCIMQDTFILEEPDELSASIANNGFDVICDSSGELLATGTGGTLPYTFSWDNGVPGPNNDNIGPGSYVLTLVDSNGCQTMDSFIILEGDTVLVNQVAAICEGEILDWNGLLLTADTLVCQVHVLPNGCDSTVCLSLVVNPLPQPHIIATGSLCNLGSVGLAVDSIFSVVQWSTGVFSPAINVTSAGTYAVTATNNFNCSATENIVVSPGIDFEYTATNPTCFGMSDGSIVIDTPVSGTPPFFYAVDSINFFQSSEFANLPPGHYFPAVIDATGCKVIGSTILVAPPIINLQAGADLTIQLGEPITLMATTNLVSPSILWQPSDFLDCPTCLSTTAQPLYTITYTVTAADADGCFAMDTVAVQVEGGGNFYIPTAFSPNGDGINDGLTVFSDASISHITSISVYDRWGELVFQATDIFTNDESKGWDGMFRGKKMSADTYVYVIRLLWVDGKEEVVKGEVILTK